MAHSKNEIKMHYADPEINDLLKKINGAVNGYTCHYNQNEEMFIRLTASFSVPHFPIHHDVRLDKPSEFYLSGLRSLMHQLVTVAPEVFQGMTYFFDPGETLRPCFYQIFRAKDFYYLYLMRLDLTFRVHEAELEEKGDNDTTASFKTSNLFLDADIIPLEGVDIIDGKVSGFLIKQTISQTWIGETGRGYFLQGIWIDNELTKFFSKLFLPKGKRVYPYYPFTCKYRTICHTLLDLTPEGRRKHLPHLHKAINFTVPNMNIIQKALKSEPFSLTLPLFIKLKSVVPDYWDTLWQKLQVTPYLNHHDMKEFKIDFTF